MDTIRWALVILAFISCITGGVIAFLVGNKIVPLRKKRRGFIMIGYSRKSDPNKIIEGIVEVKELEDLGNGLSRIKVIKVSGVDSWSKMIVRDLTPHIMAQNEVTWI